MSLPKLPLRIDEAGSEWRIYDANGRAVEAGWNLTIPGWPIPDARQAAERRLAELTRMIEDATPKCPIRKGCDDGYHLGWWMTDCGGIRRLFRTEAERDAVYDALVALWHKENGT